MPKSSFWFKHYADAQYDLKLVKLDSRFGYNVGYGTFFRILEVLLRETDNRLSLDDLKVDDNLFGTGGRSALAQAISYPGDDLEAIISAAVDLGLFEIKRGYLSAPRMNKDQAVRATESEKKRRQREGQTPGQPRGQGAGPGEEERRGEETEERKGEGESLDFIVLGDYQDIYPQIDVDRYWIYFMAHPSNQRLQSTDKDKKFSAWLIKEQHKIDTGEGTSWSRRRAGGVQA